MQLVTKSGSILAMERFREQMELRMLFVTNVNGSSS
jgi:hypothetical protein